MSIRMKRPHWFNKTNEFPNTQPISEKMGRELMLYTRDLEEAADLQRRKAEAFDWEEKCADDIEIGLAAIRDDNQAGKSYWVMRGFSVDDEITRKYEGATLLEAVESAMAKEREGK